MKPSEIPALTQGSSLSSTESSVPQEILGHNWTLGEKISKKRMSQACAGRNNVSSKTPRYRIRATQAWQPQGRPRSECTRASYLQSGHRGRRQRLPGRSSSRLADVDLNNLGDAYLDGDSASGASSRRSPRRPNGRRLGPTSAGQCKRGARREMPWPTSPTPISSPRPGKITSSSLA